MKIDYIRLQKLLAHQAGNKTTIVTFAAKTIPPMRKTNNYLGRVYKIARVNGIIGIWVYMNSVNLQRLREGKEGGFEPWDRTWGARIPGSPFVRHKNKLYLETKVQKASSAIYLDGKLASKKQLVHIEKFLQIKEGESKRQKVDKEIVLRDYDLNNITHLQLDGEVYEIEN
jgi:hypothetical protein